MLFGCAIALNVNAIVPAGAPEEVIWPRGERGHKLAESGIIFELDGPMAVTIEVRARRRNRNQSIAIEILRDDRYLSLNAPTFQRLRRAPRGYPVAARLSFEVPDGSHRYRITSPIRNGALIARKVGSVQTAFAAAPEGADADDEDAKTFAKEEVATAMDNGRNPLALAEISAEPGDVRFASGAPKAGDALESRAAESESSDAKDAGKVDAVVLKSSSRVAADAVGSSFANVSTSRNQKALRVAVYDFELAAVDVPIGAVVTDSTLAEVRKLSGISAIGMDEIRDMLSHEANKQILGCEDNSECLAEIAGALGVDQLVTGKLSRVDDGTAVVFRRIDQNRATVLETFEQRLTGASGEEFLATVGPAIEKLFPDHHLREGAERGVPDEMALRLNPPPVPTWGFYSVAGTALVSASVATGFGVAALVSKDRFETTVAAGSADSPANGAEVVGFENDFRSQRNLSNAFWISTGVLAIATGVVYFFTDWEGYQEAEERLEANP